MPRLIDFIRGRDGVASRASQIKELFVLLADAQREVVCPAVVSGQSLRERELRSGIEIEFLQLFPEWILHEVLKKHQRYGIESLVNMLSSQPLL